MANVIAQPASAVRVEDGEVDALQQRDAPDDLVRLLLPIRRRLLRAKRHAALFDAALLQQEVREVRSAALRLLFLRLGPLALERTWGQVLLPFSG